MMASVKGHTEVMHALLATGANIDLQDDVYGQTALMWASGAGHTEAVSALLAAGASMDAQRIEDGATALEMALAEGHRDVVDRLAQALKKRLRKQRVEQEAADYMYEMLHKHAGY